MTRVLKIALVSDIGKALNPQQVEAQDEGAAVMGLGHTLMEHLILDDQGRIRNLGALDYRIPTTQDIADHLESVLVEHQDGPGPYGAKGAGEGGILAIAEAKLGAIGVTAVEVDPVALAVARGNARINGVASKIVFRETLPSRSRYRWVVANVTAPVLIAFSEAVTGRVRPGGGRGR